jgi:sulfur-oxidizing protein SoxZ
MANPTPRVRMPSQAKAGQVIEVKTLISHEMETGQRKDAKGKTILRKIIKNFTAKFNGKEIFRSDWHPAVSANPYLAFFRQSPGGRDIRVVLARRRRLRLQVRAYGQHRLIGRPAPPEGVGLFQGHRMKKFACDGVSGRRDEPGPHRTTRLLHDLQDANSCRRDGRPPRLPAARSAVRSPKGALLRRSFSASRVSATSRSCM